VLSTNQTAVAFGINGVVIFVSNSDVAQGFDARPCTNSKPKN